MPPVLLWNTGSGPLFFHAILIALWSAKPKVVPNLGKLKRQPKFKMWGEGRKIIKA